MVEGCGFTPCSGTVTLRWDPSYGPYADNLYGAWLPDNYACGYAIGMTCIPETSSITFAHGFTVQLAGSYSYSPSWNICSAGAGPMGFAAHSYDPFRFEGYLLVNHPDGSYGQSGPFTVTEE